MAGSSTRALVRPFTRHLLAVDLPGLSAAQRDEVADFVVSRVVVLPSLLGIGVHCIAAPMRVVVGIPGSKRLIAWLIRHPLPLVGEYVRMVRSLAYTHVWETWPLTTADGTTPAHGRIAPASVVAGSPGEISARP